MKSEAQLNSSYISLVFDYELNSNIVNKIKKDFSREEKISKLTFIDFIDYMSNMVDQYKNKDYKELFEVVELGSLYKTVLLEISNYENDINKAIKEGCDVYPTFFDANIKNIKTANVALSKNRSKLLTDYNIAIDSFESYVEATKSIIEKNLESLDVQIKGLMEEAKKNIVDKFNIDMSVEDEFVEAKDLPKKIVIAKCLDGTVDDALMKAIKAENKYIGVSNDIVKKGNIILSSSFENMANEKIDNFVISYIFRMLESFPLGTLKIHIYDKNPNYQYKRLANIFLAENIGESAKNTIKLYDSLDEVCEVVERTINDIVGKVTYDVPDLFSVYKNDSSDAFNLVIIRDGLNDQSGYASDANLSSINEYLKNNQSAHKCGIRFLIVDSSDSFISKQTETTAFMLNSIKSNCGLKLLFDGKKFSVEGKETSVINVKKDIDAYIQKMASNIAMLITNKERKNVSIIETIDSYDNKADSIITLPIGRCGNEIVEIPLSCKDENGTLAGQCIGYMVIGQSGSGKSSFFHSIVLSGCLKYSPHDIQFWLLDFKKGSASSKYINSKIPHIRMIAEDNKIDDALCLFQMLEDEIDRRIKLFNKQNVNEIVDYNNIAVENPELEYLPRIVILIDEAQEIFRDNNEVMHIQTLVGSIASRMRAAGLHFIMVAQNLSEGRTHMLKEAFLPHVSGRVCFRVTDEVVKSSGFGEEYLKRKKEISELKTGEAYISYGTNSVKKVAIAFASAEEMVGSIFPFIREKYSNYSHMQPMIIGTKNRLRVNDSVQDSEMTFGDCVLNSGKQSKLVSVIIGEDSYRKAPLKINFSPNTNSSLLFLGDDMEIASSLCTSAALSLISQKATLHLVNGDKNMIVDDDDEYDHPFKYLCKNWRNSEMVTVHKMNQFGDMLSKIYAEYMRRQEIVQRSDEDDIPRFENIFIVINDLFSIPAFKNNEDISLEANNTNLDSNDTDDAENSLTNRLSKIYNSRSLGSQYSNNVQNVISTLLNEGYSYNIYLIIAIKGEMSSSWRYNFSSAKNNIILYNPTTYANELDNKFAIKEALKNISSETGAETMAIHVNRGRFSKMRPVIYKMSMENEIEWFNHLLKEE